MTGREFTRRARAAGIVITHQQVFKRIISGEIPAAKRWSDDQHHFVWDIPEGTPFPMPKRRASPMRKS